VAAEPRADVDRAEAARRAVAANPAWYHTIELAPGVVTPGKIDLRRTAARILPADLSGKRALDVGTFDGFWAFELERRGAEVVAIDLDRPEAAEWPPLHRERLIEGARRFDLELGRGFELAAELLDARARRVICNVLDLTPEAIGGPVDVAFLGALLIHLRDPVRALERVHDVLVPGGELYQLEGVSIRDTLRSPRRPVANFQTVDTAFNWWHANRATLRRWLRTAGFVDIRGNGFHHPPQRRPMKGWYHGLIARRPA
jgi:SAM-dependent methyltransferase